MENIKVRDLADPIFCKVKDILPGKSGYNLYLKVVSKNVLIDIVRIDKTRVVIVDFVVGDETGVIKMRLRNDVYADMINADDNIVVRNCKVPVVNSHMRMCVDAFGKIEISNDVKIENVKVDKDYSAVVYDTFSDRKRFGGFRENNYRNEGYRQTKENHSEFSQSYNDSQSVSTFFSIK